MTSNGEATRVLVSRRINASAPAIFSVLADPARHTELDGSDMLRGLHSGGVVTGVGDVFVLRMYFSELGDYEMANHVVEFEQDRRIVWEPRRHDIDEPSWHQLWGFELEPQHDGTTVVTEIFDWAGWPADELEALDSGQIWIEAMTATLERLEQACLS